MQEILELIFGLGQTIMIRCSFFFAAVEDGIDKSNLGLLDAFRC